MSGDWWNWDVSLAESQHLNGMVSAMIGWSVFMINLSSLKLRILFFQLTASEHYYYYLSNLNLNVKICSGVGKKNVND